MKTPNSKQPQSPKTPLDAAQIMMSELGHCIVAFKEDRIREYAAGDTLCEWGGRDFDEDHHLRLTEPSTRQEWDSQMQRLFGIKDARKLLPGDVFWRAVLEKAE